MPGHLSWAVAHQKSALLLWSISRIGLRRHWACLHRLLKRFLLESPTVLSASEFVPPLGLRNPFSPISGFRPRLLQAMQFHSRALIVTHKLSSLVHNLFLLLRQSHYDYATELSLDLLVGGPALDSMSMRAWSRARRSPSNTAGHHTRNSKDDIGTWPT